MQKILSAAMFLFFLVFGAYLLVELVPSEYLGGIDRVRIVSDSIKIVASESWDFARPFIQLIIILAILQPLLEKSGVKINLASLSSSLDVRSTIAILVISAFCIAALAGVSGYSALKDVALVVVGFYFGGLVKKPETESQPENSVK
jgi:hypothetical protein